MNKTDISVLINTRNEEDNIVNCLESVKWAKEIVIVDMHSTDRTVELARKYTDRIYYFKHLHYPDPARQFAIDKATSNWLLQVDADEMVTYALKKRIAKIVEENNVDVVYVPFKTYFFGEPMLATGWGITQDTHPRLFRRGKIKPKAIVHDMTKVLDTSRTWRITNANECFVHFNYIDGEQFIDKLNRYTTIEAKHMYSGDKPANNSFQLLLHLIKDFYTRYFLLKGYKDKERGLALSLLMTAYRVSAYLKYQIMLKYNTEEPHNTIISRYKKVAERIVKEYHDK